ncbi:dual specificity phosphatase [Nitzschia inconspicua]|uniref:Dual specificity phosphatase n=1 Tax=Nitzschia inconspicua TaxID=303405 RepID=A0A9K3LH58_9STRA|nr:dual specificity phosphatase [Nitzschia inconspicua]
MGTVHGVYLKYVGLSALSYAGYSMLSSENTSSASDGSTKTLLKTLSAVVLGYSTIVNGMIAILFKTERGMSIIGKNKTTGEIPMWSYLVFFPFHIPTLLYTHVHTRMGVYKSAESKDGKAKYNPVPVASEVQKGWWVGGCYGHELGKEWGGVVDLTVEFPESCRTSTKYYLSAPTWDGVPLGPEDLEAAAVFAVEARKEGDVLIHCAHGRGRSTTVMCACLVKAGLYDNWKEAFEKGIKPFRSVCKLNKRMQESLTAWQEQFVDGKKAA